MTHPSSISDFFAGKSILVTGATGFLGKALVEKLLRSCPDIDTIYVLIRIKNGYTSIDKRIENLVKNSVFDRIRSTRPELLKKIYAIAGDISLPGLNLNSFDKHLLTTNVSLVFHSAASVNFNLELHKAVEQNVQGTRRIIALCKEMTKFEGLCHVSTAYANCTVKQTQIEEKIYSAPPGTKEILETPIDKKCSEFTPEIVGQMKNCRPNSYTYTKSIAEHVLSLEASNIPVCIVRPSMVIGSNQEPVPGWVEGLNGLNAVVIGYGTGALKVLYADLNLEFNFIPVDVTVNMIICAAWDIALCKNDTKNLVKVYNCCVPERETVKLGNLLEFVDMLLRKMYPFSRAVLHPGFTATANRIWYELNDFCWHFVPALLAELITPDGKIRPLRLYEQMKKQMTAMEFFMTHSWKFATDNGFLLYNSLSEADRTEFSFKIENFKWHDFAERYILGARRYIMKDSDSTICTAQNRMKALKFRTTGLKALLVCSFILLAIILTKCGILLNRIMQSF